MMASILRMMVDVDLRTLYDRDIANSRGSLDALYFKWVGLTHYISQVMRIEVFRTVCNFGISFYISNGFWWNAHSNSKALDQRMQIIPALVMPLRFLVIVKDAGRAVARFFLASSIEVYQP